MEDVKVAEDATAVTAEVVVPRGLGVLTENRENFSFVYTPLDLYSRFVFLLLDVIDLFLFLPDDPLVNRALPQADLVLLGDLIAKRGHHIRVAGHLGRREELKKRLGLAQWMEQIV